MGIILQKVGVGVGGVTVLDLFTLSDNTSYSYQVLSKYLIRFQSYGPEQ